MTRAQVVTFLDELERKYPVDTWCVNGMHVWPVLKKIIFFEWFKINVEQTNKSTRKNKIGNLDKFKAILNIVISAAHFVKFLASPKTKVSVLFLGANSHRVVLNDKYINRYFQPIIEQLINERDNFISLDHSVKDSEKNYPIDEAPIFIRKYLPFAGLYIRYRYGLINVKLDGFSELIKDIQNSIDGFDKIDFKDVLFKNLSSIQQYAFIFDLFLKKYSPSNVIGLCYYSNPVYGLINAASKLRINSIDLQHGGQGELNIAYSNFSKIPKGGFNTMPRTFWCWDETSKSTIAKWVDMQSYHKVETSGNPWLSYCANSQDNLFPEKKIILYTLQFDKLDEYIIQAISDTSSDYEWWIRLHPRKIYFKSELSSIIKERGLLDKVNITEATDYPLPQILAKACVHLTKFSGSIIEAAQTGVKSIILDKIGVETYKDYINHNLAEVLLSECSQDLLRLILKIDSEAKGGKSNGEVKYKTLINREIK